MTLRFFAVPSIFFASLFFSHLSVAHPARELHCDIEELSGYEDVLSRIRSDVPHGLAVYNYFSSFYGDCLFGMDEKARGAFHLNQLAFSSDGYLHRDFSLLWANLTLADYWDTSRMTSFDKIDNDSRTLVQVDHSLLHYLHILDFTSSPNYPRDDHIDIDVVKVEFDSVLSKIGITEYDFYDSIILDDRYLSLSDSDLSSLHFYMALDMEQFGESHYQYELHAWSQVPALYHAQFKLNFIDSVTRYGSSDYELGYRATLHSLLDLSSHTAKCLGLPQKSYFNVSFYDATRRLCESYGSDVDRLIELELSRLKILDSGDCSDISDESTCGSYHEINNEIRLVISSGESYRNGIYTHVIYPNYWWWD